MISRALLVFLLIASLLASGAVTAGAALCPGPDAVASACGCCGPSSAPAAPGTPTLGQPMPLCCHMAPGNSRPASSPSPASLPTAAGAKEMLSAHFAAAMLPRIGALWMDGLPAASSALIADDGIAPPGSGGHDGFADNGRARQPAPRALSGILLI